MRDGPVEFAPPGSPLALLLEKTGAILGLRGGLPQITGGLDSARRGPLYSPQIPMHNVGWFESFYVGGIRFLFCYASFELYMSRSRPLPCTAHT